MSAPSGRPAGVVAALVAVSIWGGWIPITRLGLVTHLTAEDVAAQRFAVAGLTLAPVLMLRWRRVPWRRGALLLKERLRPAQLVGLALTLLGVGFRVIHDALQGGARLDGFGLILAGSCAWAGYALASRALAPLLNAALVCCSNAALYLPFYLASGGAARLASVPVSALWLQLLYQGLLTAVVALIAFAFAVQRLGAAAAAGFSPLAPVLATLFGWVLLGDPVSPATAAGLAAVTGGVLIAGRAAAASPRR